MRCGLQGVWTDGRHAISVGLDQRLRAWSVGTCVGAPDTDAAPGVLLAAEEVGTTVVQVVEPEALSVEGDAAQGWHVAVAGRGLQVLHLGLDSLTH